MLDKSIKVKQPTPAELASNRHDSVTARQLSVSNLEILRSRRQSQPAVVPDLVQQSGFPAYVRRLEREARLLGPDRDAPAARGWPEQPLGNNTESRAGIVEVLDEKTGEIQRLTVDPRSRELRVETPREFASINARAARFSAQTSAGKLLHAQETPRGSQWRVTGCSRRKVGAEVSILYSSSIKKAHFGGLMVCGSVWTCPPCAAKVSERRKNEISDATDRHKLAGGALYMITHTFSHQRHDNLDVMLAAFAKARQLMRAQRAYKELRVVMGYVGDVRALEVTYGDDNGWHPHEHDLWLTAKRLSDSQLRHLKSTLFTLWHRACIKAGLAAPNRQRGVNVIEMQSAAEYVAKFGREPRWGVGAELAKQHTKSGKVKSMTPFDLLRRYHEGSDDGSHKRFGALFVQFAKSFFGKRQIVWSRGLKELFGIVEMTDEEVAVVEAEDARELVRITTTQWRCVLHQKFDVRQILLERAESGGHDAVVQYLDSLMENFVPF